MISFHSCDKGSRAVIVSGLQTLNNSRIVFSGSSDMFSNTAYNQSIANQQSGNKLFLEELFKWTFKEKRVLDIKEIQHSRLNDTIKRQNYRIKDTLIVKCEVSEWENKRWNSFMTTDMQFEAVMLDPYIRKTLSLSSTTPVSTIYEALIILPDQYGVFTFKVTPQIIILLISSSLFNINHIQLNHVDLMYLKRNQFKPHPIEPC